MLLIKLLNIINGYIVIIVEGFFLERFLNICTRRGIYLWNVRRLGVNKMRANISIKAFKMLPTIAYKSRCTVSIKSRKGIPFFVHKHRKRKAFAIGIFLFCLLIYVMTMFVWVIEISGNKTLSQEQITKILADSGIKTGTLKQKIDTDLVRNNMMMTEQKLGWVGLNIKGTTAMVEIKERAEKPELFPKDKPCNIIAAEEGVIETINVTNGEKMAKKGDVVHQGQLLVSGALDSKIQGIRFLHADAQITARTWRKKTVSIPQYEDVKTRTKRHKSKHSIKILNFYIKFYINDRILYTNYDRISYVKKLSIGNNNVLPISFHYDNYYELDVQQREVSNEQAVEMIKAQMDEEYKDKNIVNKEAVIEGDKLTVTYEILEDIVKKVVTNDGEAVGSGNN